LNVYKLQIELPPIHHGTSVTIRSIPVSGQQWSNLRLKNAVWVSDTLTVDTLSLVPESVRIEKADGTLITEAAYALDWGRSTLYFNEFSGLKYGDSLLLFYRVYPFLLGKSYRNKEPGIINRSPEGITNPFLFTYATTTEDVFQLVRAHAQRKYFERCFFWQRTGCSR
jgi:hypothetical protein